MKSKAVVASGPGQVAYREVESPAPGPQDVVVRVHRSWISNGTEGSYVRGERIGGDTPWRPGDPLPFPHIPYQKAGTVAQVGEKVTKFEVGDLVFASVCRVEGMFFPYAGHISPGVCHESQVWKLPAGADPEAFSGLVLTQVGYNVGTRPDIRPGDAVVVMGDGMVGHWSAQTLQHRGARVLLLGRHDDRLARFDLNEGDARVNTQNVDAVEAVTQWAPGGIQAIAHSAGSIESLTRLLPLLKRFGQIVSAGYLGTDAMIDIQSLRDRELSLHAVAGWSSERMAATLDLVAGGVLRTRHLITHRFPAEQAAEAFQLILEKRPGVLGVVLEWDGR